MDCTSKRLIHVSRQSPEIQSSNLDAFILITSGKEKFWRRLRDLKALTNIKIAIE
jgi:hypothetical protein